MKKITATLILFLTVLAISCEGPVGPPGEDGTSLMGKVFELKGDFKPSNNYELIFDFPKKFEIYSTDIVLVYILWDVITVNGKSTDIWRLLPQTVVLSQGVIQYNFDYTVNDVRIFLETTIPYSQLLPAETHNQVFRIVVLPAEFANKNSTDLIDYDFLLELPGLKLDTIEKIEIK